MKALQQQFIVNYLKENAISVPRSFLDPEMVQKLHHVGFELPSEKFYSKYVSALNNRYPARHMIPFAKSSTDDDTVGFLIRGETEKGSIISIHDFTEPGWEMPQFFNDLLEWLEFKANELELR